MQRSRLLDISDDIFVDILLQCDVLEVVSLRTVCRRISAVTYARPLWTAFAHLEVLGKGLPWPSSAWPLSSVPTETIEILVIKAVLLSGHWDAGYPRSLPFPTKCIRYPEGSVTWVHLLNSRWLVIGLKSHRLEIWDLGVHPADEERLVTFEECLSGYVTSGVSSVEEDKVFLAVNTHDAATYLFRVRVPRRHPVTAETVHSDVTLKLTDIRLGYSKILGNSETLLAFARAAEAELDSPLIVSRESDGHVRLACGEGVDNRQYVLDVEIRKDVVVVARTQKVEIYSTESTKAALQRQSRPGSTPEDVSPVQSLSYPGNAMVWQASIAKRITNPGSDNIVLCVCASYTNLFTRTVDRWVMTRDPDSSTSNGYSFQVITVPRWPQYIGDYTPALTSWGATGDRRVDVDYNRPDPSRMVVHGYKYQPPDVVQRWEARSRKWQIPLITSSDIPWHCIFDEATGVVIIGMRSGKLWILDPNMPVETLRDGEAPYVETDDDVWSPAKLPANYVWLRSGTRTGLPFIPRVLASRWPGYLFPWELPDYSPTVPEDEELGLLPPPWADRSPFSCLSKTEALSRSCIYQPPIPPDEIPESWTNDWFLKGNLQDWHEEYGGRRWYFNEVLHIPGRPLLLLIRASPHHPWLQELVTIGGRFYMHMPSPPTRTTMPIGDNLTLDTLLALLRAEPYDPSPLYGRRLPGDLLAVNRWNMWRTAGRR